jgi:RHS repeat-associated protein
VRTDARVATGAPAKWQSSATTVNTLARVTTDQTNALGRSIPTSGVSLGANYVELFVDGSSHGRATHPGWADNTGAWNKTLTLGAGSHTLKADAVHPSGKFTASAFSTFTVNVPLITVTSAYDADGNVTSRTFSNGIVQTLTWDAFNRLIKVAQRDSVNNGYDWTAVYDAFGRRLRTTEQAVTANVLTGSPLTVTSHFDPQVEFLELGVEIAGRRAWKVYGPDLNGIYGGLNGTGGVEAVFREPGPDDHQSNAWVMQTALTDVLGNVVGTASGNAVKWSATRVGGNGPLPGSVVQRLNSLDDVLAASTWRTRRFDVTGFAWMGARHYDYLTARWLSVEPLGHAVSMSLYDYCSGDGLNYFDADGRISTKFKAKTNEQVMVYFPGSPQDPRNKAESSPFTGFDEESPISAAPESPIRSADPAPWDIAQDDPDQLFSVTAGGEVAAGVGAGASMSKDGKKTNLDVDATIGAGAIAYGGGQLNVNLFNGNPDKAEWGVGGKIAVVGAAGVDLKFKGMVPTQLNLFVGVGIGGEAKLQLPAPSMKLIGAELNNNTGEVQGSGLFNPNRR